MNEQITNEALTEWKATADAAQGSITSTSIPDGTFTFAPTGMLSVAMHESWWPFLALSGPERVSRLLTEFDEARAELQRVRKIAEDALSMVEDAGYVLHVAHGSGFATRLRYLKTQLDRPERGPMDVCECGHYRPCHEGDISQCWMSPEEKACERFKKAEDEFPGEAVEETEADSIPWKADVKRLMSHIHAISEKWKTELELTELDVLIETDFLERLHRDLAEVAAHIANAQQLAVGIPESG